jgi:hypothetical protein
MPNDLLRAYANERVDLVDFDFLADSGLQANIRQPNEQFFTDPSGQRAWIIDGFEIDNPSGDQVRVFKGRAILGQREGALVHYGALTVEGDTEKIVDMSTLTPAANYGLYVRFEFVDGNTSSRIFWNPAGTGTEVAQAVATRRNANWSIRIELTNPGSEYLKIATLDNTGVGVAITDERPMYFEGEIHNSYESGWSTDGGGGSNDRNADRQQYGVKDFQTFTAAMRQCLEDIKGRGLRRWWERDIGGLNVGFDADPVENRVAVGDGNFSLYYDGTDPFIYFGADDYLQFDRSLTAFYLAPNNNKLFRVDTSGTRVNGIAIHDTLSLQPETDKILIHDVNFGLTWDGTDPNFLWDSSDYTTFDRSENFLQTFIAGTKELQVEEDGVRVRGLAISSNNSVNPGVGGMYVGDANFVLYSDGSEPYIKFDGAISTRDELRYFRSTNRLIVYISGNTIWEANAIGTKSRGLSISNDLSVAAITDGLTIGDSGYYLFWDGIDPYLYFDTNDYLWYDRDLDTHGGLNVVINSAVEAKLSSNGLIVKGLSVDSTLASAPPADNTLKVGNSNFSLYWDGSNSFIYLGASDTYFTHVSAASVLDLYINGSAMWQTGTVGTKVKGLAVSSGLSLNPVAGRVTVGDADFYLYDDSTDAFIHFDGTSPNDAYLKFDRSSTGFEFYTLNTKRHAWTFDSGWMLGQSGLTGLVDEGEYTYDSSRGLWAVRDQNNTGSVNTHVKKGSSSLIRKVFAYPLTITTTETIIANACVKAGRQGSKVFRLITWGTAVGNASNRLYLRLGVREGVTNQEIQNYFFEPDAPNTDDDVRDQWWAECLFDMATGGTSARIKTFSRMAKHESSGVAATTINASTSYDKVVGVNMDSSDLILYLSADTDVGTVTVNVRSFLVEELFGQ